MNPQQPTLRNLVGPPQPTTGKVPLAYLFVAEFADGTVIGQTPEDESEHTEGKNAFYDVIMKSREVDLIRFHLNGGESWYTVDLRDGLFEINGYPIYAHNQFLNPADHGKLHLIYHKEKHEIWGGPNHGASYVNRFFIGWWIRAEDDVYTPSEDENGKAVNKLLYKKGDKIEQTIAIH